MDQTGAIYTKAAQSHAPSPRIREQDIESALLSKLRDLKYTIHPDIRDRASLEASPRRAMEQIVEYKSEPGNGYTKNSPHLLNRNSSTWNQYLPAMWTQVAP